MMVIKRIILAFYDAVLESRTAHAQRVLKGRIALY